MPDRNKRRLSSLRNLLTDFLRASIYVVLCLILSSTATPVCNTPLVCRSLTIRSTTMDAPDGLFNNGWWIFVFRQIPTTRATGQVTYPPGCQISNATRFLTKFTSECFDICSFFNSDETHYKVDSSLQFAFNQNNILYKFRIWRAKEWATVFFNVLQLFI